MNSGEEEEKTGFAKTQDFFSFLNPAIHENFKR
jgi:hypothetical protein